MSSLAVKLPITRNTADGFTMIKNFKTLIRQNLKMLVLTAPGERVMEPAFGVGARQYLFENFGDEVYQEIAANVRKQVREFMPAIGIQQINFDTSSPDRHILGIRIVYSIPDIGVTDLLEFTI
jgi:phage baseplate assembly protein W